jgi:peptide/nickel transport system permease protein
MAVIAEDEALVLDGRAVERPPLSTRIVRGIRVFARRKPLGFAGGILLLFPILAAIILPGVGPLPSILKYGYQEYTLGQDILLAPSGEHFFGTDHLGRDLFSRLLYGSRLSYMIGFSVFAISSTMSITLTILCAYYIRTVDLILQRVIEVVGYLPDLILIITLFSIYGASPLTLILTLGILRGFDTGRILRSLVISVRGMPYIEAAKSLGATDRRIILRHILPQIGFLIIVQTTNGLASAVLVESGLAILGFGLDPTYPTLGNLLNGSRQYLRVAPWLALFPGLTIFMLLLGARLLGDALRDVLDPRLRGSGK